MPIRTPLSEEELKGVLIGNLIAQLEAQKEVLISEGESILEIETQLADARLALKAYETEQFTNSEKEKQDAIQKTIDTQTAAVDGIVSLTNSVGAFFAQGDADAAKFINGFTNAITQFAALSKIQISASQSVTAAKTAEGVANAASLPFPANIAAVATTLATVVSAFSTVRGLFQKTSNKYYWGKDEISQGMGDRDDVPSMLRRGERVVPVHINKQLKGIKNADLPKLLQRSHSPNQNTNSGVSEISLDQTALNNAVASQTKTHFHLDENGFTKRIYNNGNEIIYRKNRYQ